LREVLADRLQSQGVPAAPERILIVQGSQQGMDLVARRLLSPGDLVALESPTYANALTLYRKLGLQMVPIPLDDEGMRPDVLERVASRESIRLLYTMPSFQNPTGLTQSLERRKELLDVAARWGIPVLEDLFAAELRYQGEPLPALKSLDSTDQVLLLGTFSKMLFPGLRVGWLLVPEPLYDSLKRLVRATSLSTSALTQEVLAEFCRRGFLDQHLRRVCAVYASRRKTLLDSMEEFFPEEAAWTRPEDGGMTLWVTLPPRINAVSVALEARKHGVHIAPGPFFFVEGGHGNLSLSSTAEPEERLRDGVRRLGGILKKALTEAGTGPGREREEAPWI
jgi:DNA-binding transcriptional MocR family regulator